MPPPSSEVCPPLLMSSDHHHHHHHHYHYLFAKAPFSRFFLRTEGALKTSPIPPLPLPFRLRPSPCPLRVFVEISSVVGGVVQDSAALH